MHNKLFQRVYKNKVKHMDFPRDQSVKNPPEMKLTTCNTEDLVSVLGS